MKFHSLQLGAALMLFGAASPLARVFAQTNPPMTLSTEHPELLQQTIVDAPELTK